ncbi:MAG: hypothetical protein J6W84_03350 [Bacteroidales bacterium]|nr:hypothetical protein [Bacteroidales bacterium]
MNRQYSPCYTCVKRCLLCHSHCKEYADWVKEMAERPKRPKHEVEADAVEIDRPKRIRKQQQEKAETKYRRK